MSKLINKETKVENMIYEVRGVQVMLDSDLAELYHCKNGTKDINKAVKRNINRFPDDFYFQLTKEEYENLKFQIGTSNNNTYSRFQTGTLNKNGDKRGSNIKYLPYVFTEQGVSMLASVLRTEVAVEQSIKIMRAFVTMRKYISSGLIEQKYINKMVIKHDEDIKLLQESFDKFQEKKKINEIFFKGQIFDAYYAVLEIFKKANKKLIIIDNYADNKLLDIVKRLNVKVILITSKESYLTSQDIEKYNEQYHNLTIYYNDSFHDRYFILDNKTYYHCGSSLNRLGYKTFSINELSDNEVQKSLLNSAKKIILGE